MASEEEQHECLRRTFSDALGVPFSQGNVVSPLRNGVEIFPAMLKAIDDAVETVEFVTYVYWRGTVAREFAEAFSRAAKRGVQVRVLLDAVGGGAIESGLVENMRRAGVEFAWFRPVSMFWRARHRTHRKILVCDGRVGFTGGVGIAAEWEGDARHPGEWRDTHFRICGPAVRGLRAAFVGNWIETEGSLVDLLEDAPEQPRSGDGAVQVIRSSGSVGWEETAVVFWTLSRLVERSIRITTAYFVPDRRTTRFLISAVRRGASVELMVPARRRTDSRLSYVAGSAHYAALLEAGVRIYEYQPTMLHAKTLTMDGRVAWLGSSNFNQRSMRQDDEIGLLAIAPDVCSKLDAHFEEDKKRCEEIEPQRWSRRSPWQKAAEWLVHPVRSEL